jgi:hypothetical protein
MRCLFLSLLLLPALAACGDDAITPVTDTSPADTSPADTSPADILTDTSTDTGMPEIDTSVGPDTEPVDTSPTDTALDTSPTDTALDTGPDANPGDTSNGNASSQIQALIDAALQATAPVVVDITLQSATVTMVKPAIEMEKPGFFLQADKLGPAIFVVNETAQSPNRGDLISLRATQVGVVNGVVQVLAFDGISRGTGGNATALLQNVDTVDLAADYAAFQSEAITFDLEVVGDFGAAGSGFRSAQIVTAGNQTANDNLKLRLPTPIVTSLALSPGCLITVEHGVLWRFKGSGDFVQSQPSVFDPADLDVVCEGPELVSAAAASDTSVLLNFNKAIDPASVNANGSQFSIPGLTVTAAVVNQRTVTLTTSSQAAGTNYTVTVAASVVDLAGRPAVSPAGQNTFSGFAGLTKLLINEVDYDQPGDDTAEFIELYNPNATPVDLSGYVIVLVNGNTSTAPALYQTPLSGIALSGTLPGNGYAVVSNAGVVVPAGVLNIVSFGVNGTIQNGGNDGVQLRTSAGVVVDALLYETQATVDAALLAFGEGTPFNGSDAGSGLQSVARCGNGGDTDDNATDFKVSTTPSPGAENVCQ